MTLAVYQQVSLRTVVISITEPDGTSIVNVSVAGQDSTELMAALHALTEVVRPITDYDVTFSDDGDHAFVDYRLAWPTGSLAPRHP